MRLLVQWNLVAKTRPTNAVDPFDPAYELDDVDEAVRSAQENDQEVILTISGTPRWANGGKTPNVMPTRVSDFTSFTRAIASRYSGRLDGFPFVRFWSIWNEPNLQGFLSPQFDSRGRSVAPANYAKLAAAGYTGIKAGNPQAQIAIGETSARGSDKANGLRPTHSPGKFAELVAKANPHAEVRRVVAPSVSDASDRTALAGRQMAQRLARVAAEVRRQPEDLVQAQVGTDLGDGVRVRDASRGPAGRPVLDAGREHPAGDVDRRRLPVRGHVHLVRLPGRPGPAVGLGDLQRGRQSQGNVARQVLRERPSARSPATASHSSRVGRSRLF